MSASYYDSAKFKASRARTAKRRYWRDPEKARQRLRDYRARKQRERLTIVRDAELLDHIQTLDDVIGWIEAKASTESDVALLSALTRAAQFLVDLREQRRNGGGAT